MSLIVIILPVHWQYRSCARSSSHGSMTPLPAYRCTIDLVILAWFKCLLWRVVVVVTLIFEKLLFEFKTNNYDQRKEQIAD